MERAITHPTKEQVRAYMAEREAARRPPPAPDEIRRQLGWQLCPSETSSDPVAPGLSTGLAAPGSQVCVAVSSLPVGATSPASAYSGAPSAGGQLVAVLAFNLFFSPWHRALRYYSSR